MLQQKFGGLVSADVEGKEQECVQIDRDRVFRVSRTSW